MSVVYVSAAWANTGVTNKEAVEEETHDISDYMYYNTSGNFDQYTYGHVPIGSTSGEEDFIKTVLNEIHYNSDYPALNDNETVLIPHDNWTWGYGKNLPYEIESDLWVLGCTVYAGTQIPEVESRIMAWHEAGHSWTYDRGDTGGEHARASANCCNSSSQMYNITPLTAAYARDQYGEPYMKYAGSTETPDDYCNGQSNERGTSCWGCHTSGAFDYSRYSSCVLNDAEDWLATH